MSAFKFMGIRKQEETRDMNSQEKMVRVPI